MPKTALTDLFLRSVKSDTQVDFWDTRTSGFGVRVGKRSKTFVAKVGNKRHTIGIYPDITLQSARKRALALKSQDTAEAKSAAPLFGEAADLFLATHCQTRHRASTKREMERLFKRHFTPFRPKPVDQVTHEDLTALFDRLLDTPSEANHAFKAARTFFRWCMRRRYLVQTPLAMMQPPAKTKSRDRVLTDAELVSVWRAAERAGHPFGTIVQLLILTGQRRSEIAGLQWPDINTGEQTITLPVTKNGRAHTFPYNGTVSEVLSRVPRLNSTSLLFPARASENAFNGWSKAKETMEWRPPIRPWTLHDLRRTFATNLAALGTPIHVLERILNHVAGAVSGVAFIYNRYAYQDEMRVAIEKWDTQFTALLARH